MLSPLLCKLSFAGSGHCDSWVPGGEGAGGYLREAAGQHGGPAQEGDGDRAMETTPNAALRSDRSAGEKPRSVVINTAVMTPVTLLEEPRATVSKETLHSHTQGAD